MSWIDQLNDVPCEIQTGDGKKYQPLWREAKRSRNYNTSAYNFINIPGTLIDRRMPEGNQYDLTIIFSGTSHLAISESFQQSADDKRAWTITHPYWGSIKVQPLSIEEDKSILNNTIFRIKVWETIPFMYPWRKQFANDAVRERFTEMSELAALSFANQVTIDTGVRNTLLSSVTAINNTVSKKIKGDSAFAKFQTAVSKARSKINDVTQKPIDVMRSVINLVNYPIEQITGVIDRLNVLKETKDKLIDILLGVTSKDNLIIFESLTSAFVGAMAVTAMEPGDDDYQIRTEVVEAMGALKSAYEGYLQTLDTNSGERSDDTDTFAPDRDTLSGLADTVTEALANIYDYSFGAKQERVIMLEEDSNAIVLAHRFYGLDKDDVNLTFFIRTNDLSMDELIEIKKGRKIYYYK